MIVYPRAQLWPGESDIRDGFSGFYCHGGVAGHRPFSLKSAHRLVRERNFILFIEEKSGQGNGQFRGNYIFLSLDGAAFFLTPKDGGA